MRNLYLTADKVGLETGGGSVTYNESQALATLGPCEVWDREKLPYFNYGEDQEPWKWDDRAWSRLLANSYGHAAQFKVCHIYAGTFTKTVELLKGYGCKITVTAAAHDIAKSRKAHLDLGLPYDYPHLTDPKLFRQYVGGYCEADVLIVPSTHSRDVMRQWTDGRIEVIPHGVNLPKEVKPLPKTFRIGYLGSYGADKGVRYLLEAWKKLAYPDATLVLAGRDSTGPWVRHLIQQFGGGNIELMGWVKNVGDFYNSISLYVQPSVSEGFGCEVTESMAYGRVVLCSETAGAKDVAICTTYPQDTDSLAERINEAKKKPSEELAEFGRHHRKTVEGYTWDIIKERYCQVWRELLNG